MVCAVFVQPADAPDAEVTGTVLSQYRWTAAGVEELPTASVA
jgi:hypothetical protein